MSTGSLVGDIIYEEGSRRDRQKRRAPPPPRRTTPARAQSWAGLRNPAVVCVPDAIESAVSDACLAAIIHPAPPSTPVKERPGDDAEDMDITEGLVQVDAVPPELGSPRRRNGRGGATP